MVEEVLVKDALSSEMIETGKLFTESLDRVGMPVAASMWFYNPEANCWEFAVASEMRRAQAPRVGFAKIREAIASLPTDGYQLSQMNVRLVDPSYPPVVTLRNFIKSSGLDLTGQRITQSAFDGRYIEDAYIYKIAV